jgi:hypothetical protein
MEDGSLRASFKQFCKPAAGALACGGGALKIKVPRDALVFDAEGGVVDRGALAPGAAVRAILELSRVCFGRTEFGAMWSLVQAQTAPAPPPPPRCLIAAAQDDDEDAVDHPSRHRAAAAPDTEVHEFL